MKDINKSKRERRIRRHHRVTSKIWGTQEKPRLNVFKSLNSCFLQLIDDAEQKTLLSAGEKELKDIKKLNKTDRAFALGELIAKKAQEKGIKEAVFDRGGYKFHGRVKAVAEGARKGGLKF